MAALAEERSDRRGLLPRYTLKSENVFLLADAFGDIHSGEDGLFADDTRLLSRFELSIADRPPSLLGAAVDHNNTLFTAHLTNRPLPNLGEQVIPQGVIHIARNRFLHAGRLYEHVCLTNFGQDVASLPLRFVFAADFADIFEVQGHVRGARGNSLEPHLGQQSLSLSYRGLDQRVRTVTLSFSLPLTHLSATEALVKVRMAQGDSAELFLEVDTQGTQRQPLPSRERFDGAMQAQRASMCKRLEEGATVTTAGRLFNEWIEKSHADLALLTTGLPTGPYPYAGIPWFATPFGRDALIAALQTLWLKPQLAAGVLRFLAATQASDTSQFREAEPGKILHEMRRGEMAALKEVPFGRYYGAVDSTPLFVMLAGSYEARTGDRRLIDEIWTAVKRAVGWIEARMERSPTGFLDYCGSPNGLMNQAWKDSSDSIFHADGSFPEPPVAVVEVQGYVYAALRAMAQLLRARGEITEAQRLQSRAESVRQSVEERFWAPELEFYGIAIDGKGKLCRTRASNAGQLLFCEIPSEQRAQHVIRQLAAADFNSGWGIRTLAAGQARFNPMSYHNGSVWPHDTALCAAGMAKYGRRREVLRLLSEVFEAANQFSMRLPELFCGFARVEGQAPTPYPVACLPQAWAAGALFMLLQSCLGVRIDGTKREIHVDRPQLPIGIESLTVQQLPLAEARIDLRFYHRDDQMFVEAQGAEDIALVIDSGTGRG